MAYTPDVFTGSSLTELRAFLETQLQRIAVEMADMVSVELRPISREPERPQDGMLIFADGTNFNPGGGAGTYERRGGAWHKL